MWRILRVVIMVFLIVVSDLCIASDTPSDAVTDSGDNNNVYLGVGAYLKAQYAVMHHDYSLASKEFDGFIADYSDQSSVIVWQRAMHSFVMDGDIDAAASYATRIVDAKVGTNYFVHHYSYLLMAMHSFREQMYVDGREHLSKLLKLCNDLSGGDLHCRAANRLQIWEGVISGRYDDEYRAVDAWVQNADANDIMTYYHAAILYDYIGDATRAGIYYSKLFSAAGRGVLPKHLAQKAKRLVDRGGVPVDFGDVTDVDSQMLNISACHDAGCSDEGQCKPKYNSCASDYIALSDTGMIEISSIVRDVLLEIGMSLQAVGMYYESLSYLIPAQYMNSKYYDYTWFAIANAWQAVGVYESANLAYGMIDKKSPYYIRAVVTSAYNVMHNNAYDQSRDMLQEALDVASTPDDLRYVMFALASISTVAVNSHDAIMYCSDYINAHNKSGPEDKLQFIYAMRAFNYHNLDMWQEAEADLLTAIGSDPVNTDVINYYAYNKISRNEDVGAMIGILLSAAEVNPFSSDIMDSMAWGYYKIGKYDYAVALLERAVIADPLNPTINDHLGDAYWRVGRYNEAKFQWYKVIVDGKNGRWISDDVSLLQYKNGILLQ